MSPWRSDPSWDKVTGAMRVPAENLATLLERAREFGAKRVALVGAHEEATLTAVARAAAYEIANPILIGHQERVRQAVSALRLEQTLSKGQWIDLPSSDPKDLAQAAVSLARGGEADILLKGGVRTDQLLQAVLDRDAGLRTERLLSDVLLYEDTLYGVRRLVGITDGGVNVLPTLQDKVQIVKNAVDVFHKLGFERPKVALMSATETVTEAIPSTGEAWQLGRMGARGELGACDVYGPLALDNALLEWAARAKGLAEASPVVAHADIMVVPNIEAGNLLGKAVKYFGGSPCAHVAVGAAVPILIPSRVESVEDKLNAIALGVIAHGP